MDENSCCPLYLELLHLAIQIGQMVQVAKEDAKLKESLERSGSIGRSIMVHHDEFAQYHTRKIVIKIQYPVMYICMSSNLNVLPCRTGPNGVLTYEPSRLSSCFGLKALDREKVACTITTTECSHQQGSVQYDGKHRTGIKLSLTGAVWTKFGINHDDACHIDMKRSNSA